MLLTEFKLPVFENLALTYRYCAKLIGIGKQRAIWRFGFLPKSPEALYFNLHDEKYLWVLAKPNGDVIRSYRGDFDKLPRLFKKVLVEENVLGDSTNAKKVLDKLLKGLRHENNRKRPVERKNGKSKISRNIYRR